MKFQLKKITLAINLQSQRHAHLSKIYHRQRFPRNKVTFIRNTFSNDA